MKRLYGILALLLALCLLLTGCGMFGPEEEETEESWTDGTWNDLPGWTNAPGPALNPGQSDGTRHIKTVLSAEGSYDFTNPAIEYRYALPFIDLGGSHAVSCNQELESRFGSAIRQSLELMEQNKEPIVKTVSYSCYAYGSVLTLRVERTDVDGSRSSGIYSVNADTGERVGADEFCAAAGLPRDQLKTRLQAAVEQRLSEQGGADKDSVAFRTALTQSMMPLADENQLNLYLEANGALMCLTELFLPSGGTSVETIRIY